MILSSETAVNNKIAKAIEDFADSIGVDVEELLSDHLIELLKNNGTKDVLREYANGKLGSRNVIEILNLDNHYDLDFLTNIYQLNIKTSITPDEKSFIDHILEKKEA